MTQVTASQYANGYAATPPGGATSFPLLWRWYDNVFRPTWVNGINITTAWDTSVIGALTTSEQRTGLRGRPNRIVEWPLQSMAIRSATAVQNMMLHAAQTRVLVPIWPDITTADENIIDLTDFACDTTLRRLYTGGQVLVYAPNNAPGTDSAFNGIIQTVTPTALNIAIPPVTLGAAAGYRVVPCIEAELSPSLSTLVQTDRHISGTIVGVESAGPSALPALWAPGTTPTGYDEYDGIPVLDLPVRTPVQSGWNVRRDGQFHAAGLGRIGQFYGTRGRVSIPMPLQFLTRADAWRFLQFFDSRAGRVYPFWLVDPVADYELQSITSTTRIVVDGQAINADDFDFRPYIAIWLRDGTLYIRGASYRTRVGSNIVIDLDAAIGGAVTADQVARVATCYRCRFARDELVEQWATTEHMTTDVEAVELLAEKSVTISDLVDIVTAPLDNTFDATDCFGPWCYTVTNCISAVAIETTSDLSADAGGTILWNGDCWTVSAKHTCTGGPTQAVTGHTTQANCAAVACCGTAPTSLPGGAPPAGYALSYIINMPSGVSDCTTGGPITVTWDGVNWSGCNPVTCFDVIATLSLDTVASPDRWHIAYQCAVSGGDNDATYGRECNSIDGTYTKLTQGHPPDWPDYVTVEEV